MSNSEFNNPGLKDFTSTLETKTNADVSAQLIALELEEKQLDLEIKRESVSKIRAQRAAKLDEARAKIQSVMQFLATRRANQESCNHRKGGQGHQAVIRGEGTDANHCVIKHKMPNGKFQIFCQRCGREWIAPFPKLGIEGSPDYLWALQLPSDNTPSGSSTFLFERAEAVA
jgi:hypothetical protein